jgi:hypothetical protein
MRHIDVALDSGQCAIEYIGEENGQMSYHDISQMEKQVNPEKRRPINQWWMGLRPLIEVMASSNPPIKDFPLPVIDMSGPRS